MLEAYLEYATGNIHLGFNVSTVSLIFLSIGLEHLPVTHHVVLSASTAVSMMALEGAAVNSLPLAEVVLVGTTIGIVCALFDELFQRALYVHGNTHSNPPAVITVFRTLLTMILGALGVLPHASWVSPL